MAEKVENRGMDGGQRVRGEGVILHRARVTVSELIDAYLGAECRHAKGAKEAIDDYGRTGGV
jgi:hypothetical protein